MTDGAIVVGPVNTDLLLRGVDADRIPSECRVRGSGFSEWRRIEQVREVAALRRHQRANGRGVVPAAAWRRGGRSQRIERLMASACDPGEVLLIALNETMSATDATVGLVHRRRSPFVAMITSCARGAGALRWLGYLLPTSDGSLQTACEGRGIFARPSTSAAAMGISERLGLKGTGGGVAMVPLYCVGTLYAILEIGKADHAFRDADRAALATVAQAAVSRLEIIRN